MTYRLIIYAACLIALAGGLWGLHNHGDTQGEARVTAQWQAAKEAQAEVILKARIAADSRMTEANKILAQKPSQELSNQKMKAISDEKIPNDCKPSPELVRVLNL